MSTILIYSSSVVGKSMAGPAIRSWEFAKALSKEHNIILASPGAQKPDIQPDGFKLITTADPLFKKNQKEADVWIMHSISLDFALLAKLYGVRVIIDAYDPAPLELLEFFYGTKQGEGEKHYDSAIESLIFSFNVADGIICASEKQRDLWIGFLMGHGLINPKRYEQDHTLRNFIDVVPFGLSDKPLSRNQPGPRQLYNLKATDKLLLWGGGIWNWFDPLSLIKAFEIISLKRDDVKLIFMGIKHPDPTIPDMAMCGRSLALSEELKLTNRFIFFNHGWIPYEERQGFLADVDIGVSTHFDNLETLFSFRTRILDYIWAQLPMIVTQGDGFAEVIKQKELGVVVPYENPEAIAEAILLLVDDPNRMENMKKRIMDIQQQFEWNFVVNPIRKMVEDFSCCNKKNTLYGNFKECSRIFWIKFHQKGIRGCVEKCLQIVKA